ncbi:MAG: DUF362 domain-containing protein [Gracilibacteraceae bacterium]|jgi:uncharacterized Fe-S center protein|nr:DUF362 domain-containing protein [Gracilibacteraceae bacterium]
MKKSDKSDVYFTDFKATPAENLPQKLARLLRAAGMERIGAQNKFVAVKLHFGEPGNLAYLRANYARVVVDEVKKLGGRPFVTDCNTLYVGQRKNALEHLEAAYVNGYNPLTLGCHVIIADGLKGTDEAAVPVNGEFVREAKIGRAVMDADIVISLNHFKFHEQTGLGGAVKNLGMGCGSRAGKMEMHANGQPRIRAALCVACGQCARNCAHGAISFVQKKAVIDSALCVACGRCIGVCNADAVVGRFNETNERLNRKIAEYALAVTQSRPHFHITLIRDVSPFCDCHSENDRAVVPDIGMLASFDPVALDVAGADLVNAQTPLADSLLGPLGLEAGGDYFTALHPTTDWRACVEQAVKIGLGNRDYNLIRLD